MLNICFTSDENYVQHLAVAMASILKNSNQAEEFFFWIVDDGIAPESKKKLERLKKIRPFELKYLAVDPSEFENFPRRKDGLALNSYFLLKVPNMVGEVKKMLFLDCDIVVLRSLWPLFEMDMGPNYILAVEDINNLSFKKQRKMPKDSFYFNSGVFMLNCERWRDDNLEKKCFEYVLNNGHKFEFQDQEVLNGVFCGKAKKIGLEWNFQFLEGYLGSFDKNLFEKAKKDPAIVHFITHEKPWKEGCRNIFAEEYWRYLEMTEFWDGAKNYNQK